MEYGHIFHVKRTGKYYCKNMINIYISRKISIEHPSVRLASLAQLHTLYYTLHTEHAYCLIYRFFNNVVITTTIEMVEMVEMVEILDGRIGKHSVGRAVC